MPRSQKNAKLTCLVISDGRRGIENQALGLAEAVARLCPLEISKLSIEAGEIFKALPPKIQNKLKSTPEDYGITSLPNIAIGCGRQAVAPLLALKKAAGETVFTVYIQDPRIDPKHFDLVIAPQHDCLTGANVQTMIGSPNRITTERLTAAVKLFSKRLAQLPKPRIAVLIGGTSKTHKLTRQIHRDHMQAICALAEQGMSVMLTTSRRTPDWAVEDYQKLNADRNTVWVWDGVDDNPYFAFLGAADAVLVTQDSTNMLTEASASGKPVFTLPMAGKSGKFESLYASLENRCHVIPFKGSIKANKYVPLNETARMAVILLQHLGENQEKPFL